MHGFGHFKDVDLLNNIQFALIFNQLLILHSISCRRYVQLKKKSTNLQIKVTHFGSKNRIGHMGKMHTVETFYIVTLI